MRILKWFSRSDILLLRPIFSASFFQWKPGRQSWSVFNSELVKSSSLVDQIVGCHVGCIAGAQETRSSKPIPLLLTAGSMLVLTNRARQAQRWGRTCNGSKTQWIDVSRFGMMIKKKKHDPRSLMFIFFLLRGMETKQIYNY